ncbi:MAG: hypothetical protein HQM14_02545 [SAR324 cluster bacterium]|nr:hypothetical protein [SAR324 cluster bacterium]
MNIIPLDSRTAVNHSPGQSSLFLLLVLILLGWGGNSSIFAQSNFIPLKPGDLTEREDRWAFSPGLQLTGDYRIYATQKNSGKFPPNREEEDGQDTLFFHHELRIQLRSTVNRNMSLNLEMETQQKPFQGGDLRSQIQSDHEQNIDAQITGVGARQAYLEYNSNPKNVFKLGKHYLNLGDRHGKVFSGVLTGISQNCKLGTWCYEIGAAKLGKHPADWLYFGSLSYPVFQVEDAANSTIHQLEVEVFRIFYTERDIPLGTLNIPTFENEAMLEELALAHATDNDTQKQKTRALSRQFADRQGRPLFYDAIGQEYFGVRLLWERKALSVRFDVTANQGKRHYHLLRDEDGVRERPDLGENSIAFKSSDVAKRSLAGVASELEVSYQLDNHQFGFRGMFATGDKEKLDTDVDGDNFLRVLNSYYEIVPGSYQGTNFYFNGKRNSLESGTGLGHSISNTGLLGGWYRWDLMETPFSYQTGLFQLKRMKPVFNEIGKQVTNIGVEWDHTFAWRMDKHFHTDFELNLLQPGDAFSFADNQAPLKRNELIIHVVARAYYSF